MTSLLEVNNLTKFFPTGGHLFKKKFVRAVDDVSFSIPSDKPTFTSLVGESGSGKTTIANLVLGLMEPTKGEIKFEGKNIKKMSRKEKTNYRKNVQAVFQDPYAVYNPFYRIDRVLELPLKKLKIASSRNDRKNLVIKSLEMVGLRPDDVLGRYPHQLSGGERQRVMLARLVSLKPRLIIADEPVSMIDVSLRSIFLNTLLDFKNRLGISCIFITHNLTNSAYLGGQVYVLYNGRIVEKADAQSLLKKPIHPNTIDLIKSVPNPDPDKKWKDKIELKVTSKAEIAHQSENRCGYYDRCLIRLDVCHEKKPQFGYVSSNHQVECHRVQRILSEGIYKQV